MIKITRSVRIEWRNNPSSFELRNKDAFKTDFLRLGSAIRPVNELLSRGAEMRALLPTIVGVSPTDSSWQERITSYMHDFLLEIPKYGLEFDTSYVFDMADPAYREAIEEFAKLKNIKGETNKEREQNILSAIQKLDETELYQYVRFVNIPDYISWRYCLLSSKVANKVEDINKSVNIQFYLTSEDEIRAAKTKRNQLRTKALTEYTKLVNDKDRTKVDAIVIASGRVMGYNSYNEMSEDDKNMALLELCDENPKAFMELIGDKHIAMKSKIQLYIWMNLLRTLPNSSIIVDASNPEKIIGNNITDAISYFANDVNKAHISELDAKYRSLKS